MTTAIVPATEEEIARAADILQGGGIVSFPTETVYGLGAISSNPTAVARVFEAKRRPFFDPLIVHISRFEQLGDLAADVPELAERVARRFWPGPLTLVLKKRECVPDIVTAGLGTVAVRMPRHGVALRLIEACGFPIAAPSANRFGATSPTEARHVQEQLGGAVDMIIDGGRCEVGVESTIVKVSGDSLELLRPGGVPVEELERMYGHLLEQRSSPTIEAPGQLPYHYSPSTPVRIVGTIDDEHLRNKDAALLFFTSHGGTPHDSRTRILSPRGDLREAAANLFSSLHELDRLGKCVIFAERVPEHDLGLAIMDRLRRASRRQDRGEGDDNA
ncbi:MAG: threonylcarbamoyl-AMP synthase [Spirochaetes bacterium]|nr:threonylcarbamoyl-AMP synthase [Spirochaetota bacterium]